MTKHRTETDALGPIDVTEESLWGAQTQRSIEHFATGYRLMPIELIQAFALLKKAAASVNSTLGLLNPEKASLINKVCDEILSGKLDDHFPLSVFQTGSGTQTNMNLNEVIANRASALKGKSLGSKDPVHPNDHVNMSQSSNDTFPTAMHIASVLILKKKLLPSLDALRKALYQKSQEFSSIIKIGRTHLMDAVPLTLGQEFSGYVAELDFAKQTIIDSLKGLYPLALGGTAVGTGLNAPPEFGSQAAQKIAELTREPFTSAPNKFAQLSSHEPMIVASSALKTLAAALMKIANDIRWMGSGPRAGLSELKLPENEPGSSIMPGKINPTQCESLTMITCQVYGNDLSLSFAASQGNFELNVFKPLIIYNFIESANLLADGMQSFRKYLVEGLEADEASIKKHLDRSLMLVTALTPKIGYDKAAQIAHLAHHENMSLKEAALKLKFLTEEEFDALLRPETMI